MQSIRLRAPASSANLGSAFDAAAIALALYNEVTATPADHDTIEVTGEGAEALRSSAPNLLLQALDRFARETGWRRPPLSLRLHNGIPLGRGLGSSAAAIVAGIRLGEALRGTALPAEQRLALAADLEGHADNTTAALLGGFTVAVPTATGLEALRLDVPANLRFAVFVPEYVVSTEAARGVLPQHVSRADAIYNVGRVALLVGALTTGELHLLGVAMDDRLHQPYRMSLYQAMQPVLDAARAAGAYGAAVSGAGPSALAPVAAERAEGVATAMLTAARSHRVAGQALVLAADAGGAGVMAA